MILLDRIYQLMDQCGYKIGNVDSLVLIEHPKLSPYKQQMAENIARVLHTDVSNVNVKATRGENLGFVGREEGVMAQAVVLLEEKQEV